jgi:histidinol-phosphate aminotransferase
VSLFRPHVDRLQPYIPGEQPQETGWVKLNTNENPYPPSPRVVEAIERMARGRLNVYPDPLGTSFRQAAAELFDLDPDWILPANGSDENLTLLIRAFADQDDLIAYPYPSYILYETLAEIQGCRHARLRLNRDWSWSVASGAASAPRSLSALLEQAKLLFVPNPNSPSGNRWNDETILSLVPPRGVLVLDEAYGDFADEPHRMELLTQGSGDSGQGSGERIVVTRTLSKSYSLAGLRFGFAVAHPDLIAGMRKVKDSYNCDAISLAAAEAAIRDQDWMRANRAKILATRTRMQEDLKQLGFDVVPSQANFVWATHPERSHATLYEQLKSRKILVRYMRFPQALEPTESNPEGLLNGLRITVGTDEEVDTLLSALREMNASP